MSMFANWMLLILSILILPGLSAGVLRKTKSLLQNRIGAPLFQPFLDLFKLLRKNQVLSEDASWVMRFSTVINLSSVILVACMVPWLSFQPKVAFDDLFLVVYLLAGARFFTMLAAMDTGSPFGGFGASREATLSLLVEPAVVLGLAALAIMGKTTRLGFLLSFDVPHSLESFPIWLLVGTAIFLSSLVELSRMPIDDPTTHLELTMVHESMLIELSGPNLALAELAYSVRMVVMYGLTVQCFLHALNCIASINTALLAVLSIAGILLLSTVTAIIETVFVKLRWSRTPEFIAYSLTMSLFATFASVLRGT